MVLVRRRFRRAEGSITRELQTDQAAFIYRSSSELHRSVDFFIVCTGEYGEFTVAVPLNISFID